MKRMVVTQAKVDMMTPLSAQIGCPNHLWAISQFFILTSVFTLTDCFKFLTPIPGGEGAAVRKILLGIFHNDSES